jgi:Fe-S cluster assembly ATP-binding protein
VLSRLGKINDKNFRTPEDTDVGLSRACMNFTIRDFTVCLGDKTILSDVNLTLVSGRIHTLMGPNGSGKSTLAAAIMGHPLYTVGEKSTLSLGSVNLNNLKTDERARRGLFLAFQTPVGIPGVTVADVLRTVVQERVKDTLKSGSKHNSALSVWKFNEQLVKEAAALSIPTDFLRRGLNEDFSGGEKKKLEMLQAIMLRPRVAIFDEVDTGLDVDALKVVAMGVARLKKEGTSVLIITHYNRILKYAPPDFVHVLVNGKIVANGGSELVDAIEKSGYGRWLKSSKTKTF